MLASIVALATLGFAHRTARAPITPDLAAFVALGGALSDICGTVDETGQASSSHCEACRINDVSFLSAGCLTIWLTTKRTFVFGFVAKQLAQSRNIDPARLVRAPPQA